MENLKTKELTMLYLIAPCRMNCGICRVYLRERNTCNGCRGDNQHKAHHYITCSIKNCDLLTKTTSGFCFDCKKYPCTRLKNLDTRYRLKYRMSMLDNLENIKVEGLEKFTDEEKVRWTCSSCGGMICVHTGYCIHCKKEIKNK
jgi:hypothetical protein